MSAEQEITTALGQIPLFQGLDDQTLMHVAEVATVREVPSGTVLFRKGDRGEEFLALLHGAIRLTVKHPDGEEVTLRVLTSGDYLGEMALIENVPRSATAETIEDCRLLALSREHFEGLLVSEPQLAIAIIKCLGRWLRHLTEDRGHQERDVYGRLTQKLLQVAETHGQRQRHGIKLNMPLPVKVLASMIGSEEAGVEHLLNLMENNGTISRHGHYLHIHDLQRLREPLFPVFMQ